MDYFKSIIFLLLSYSSLINAQDFKPLILRSWAHSNELKAKNFQLQSALSALHEAQSMYGPSVVLGGQYTLAAGGRKIEFPVGDLLNPAYNTLNQLTMTNAFPQIANVNEQFLPNNFYDLRFRVTQPIYYPDISIGKKIKSGLTDIKSLEIKAYKRVLVRDIMTTCIQIKTLEYAYNALLATDTLLFEAKRSTQSLIKNGVALPTALSKLETQLSIVDAQKIDISTQMENALAYLMHLTGKDDIASELSNIILEGYPNTLADPSSTREELSQLDKTIEVQKWALERENMYYRPKLGLQMDVGSQAFDFGFSPYALVGLSFEMNIFDSRRHKYRTDMLSSEILATEAKKLQIDDQLTLQSEMISRQLNGSVAQAKTFELRIIATQKLYNEVFTKYKQGTANYLELVDAQSQWTQMKLQYNIALQNAWIKWAEHQYVNASFPID